jgi:hypothetical protein
MRRFRRFGAALVLSSVMATGMATVFSTSVKAWDDGPVPVASICRVVEFFESAIAALPQNSSLRAYLQTQLDAIEAKYGCQP